jgi:hypothetical protein
MDGLIMDAEGGPDFFRGGVNEAHTYGNAMREVANNPKKLLGISSNDIPQNLPGWLPKFNEIATKADFNSPQTYYGASASVASRVDKAENANAHLTIPFIPVGAGSLVLSMEDAHQLKHAPNAPPYSSSSARIAAIKAIHFGIGAARPCLFGRFSTKRQRSELLTTSRALEPHAGGTGHCGLRSLPSAVLPSTIQQHGNVTTVLSA